MAGTLAHRELNRAVRFAVASEADEPAIRRLLRENPMRGGVSVRFEREPDYFRGADLGGGEDRTIVAYEENRLVCMGRCTQRECWLAGRPATVGYLAELRLDHAARRRFGILRDGYRFFREQQGSLFHFTSIASDNHRARRLLESGVRGMPAYAFLGGLVTMLIAVPRRTRATKLRLEQAAADRVPALVRFLNQHGQRHQLGTVWTAERLGSLARHGLPLERFLLAMEGGEILACGALWDQRSFRQTVVHDYAGVMRVTRPMWNVASQILGRPPLPSPGTVVAQAFLSPLAFAEGAAALLPEVIEGFLPLASALGIEWLTVALPAGDERLSRLRKNYFTRAWPSRLYRVSWPEQQGIEVAPSNTRWFPDAALL